MNLMINHDETGNKNAGIFGLGNSYESAELVLIPANWDLTTSYRSGTAQAPQKIKESSTQIDLFNIDFYQDILAYGIHMLDENKEMIKINNSLKKEVNSIQETLEMGEELNADQQKSLKKINKASQTFNISIYNQAINCIKDNKIIGLVGGDHSSSYGLVKALVENIDSFGILQLDAHMDLRKAYQGFEYSHASIMKNVMDFQDISRLIQVGVRDFCQYEYNQSTFSKGHIKSYLNSDIKNSIFTGKSWDSICKKIVNNLPKNVYISLDIDVFQTQYCPNTGTPVPGGLEFDQVTYLLKKCVDAGKIIVGFDCVEVNGDTDDINIITGSRILYHLCGQTIVSQIEDG